MARGFSLFEVLVASTVFTVAVVGLVPLLIVSTTANTNARTTTFAVALAQQKMEQLRALAWSVDASGLAVSDTTTDLTTMPERSAAGVGLSPSPAGALDRDTPGYVDFLNAAGEVIPADPQFVPAFIRRWSIDALPSNPANTLVLQVRVVRGNAAASARRLPGEAWLTSVKTRKAS
ncbi:MAG TPA: prepilin-type N-terminal cleavage/methylation domain-containing protein [Vicinamibacterales bacterium]